MLLERWGWVLETGLYMDDVDIASAKVDAQTSANIRNTIWWIACIANAAFQIIGLSGLWLDVSEHRVADAKLEVLARRVVRSQKDERARLSRDLHDGISQLLVSVKLQVESGIAKLSGKLAQATAARHFFDRAASQLNNVLGEVRRISHDLRPALLDDLGLAAALRYLCEEFAGMTTLPTTFTTIVRVALSAAADVLRLSVTDDGVGFDINGVAQHPKRGIGLRNMHERLAAIGDTLQVVSSAAGTTVSATLLLGRMDESTDPNYSQHPAGGRPFASA